VGTHATRRGGRLCCLFDCHRSRTPVLAIAAQIPSSEIGSDYFQATHPEILFQECSDYVELVSNPALLPRIMACATDIRGVRVENPIELESAIQEVLNHPGPALLDVVSARQELIMPPTTTVEQATHFGLFMIKAVMDGRGHEVIDLAKENLRL